MRSTMIPTIEARFLQVKLVIAIKSDNSYIYIIENKVKT